MTPEERALLSDLFQRLRDAGARQPRDAEAERYIADAVRADPAAPYTMAQAVLVQQHALAGAQARIEELESELRNARQPQPSGGGSFLGNLLGGGNPWGGSRQPTVPAPRPATQPAPVPTANSPWGPRGGGYGQPGYGQPGYGQPAFGGYVGRGGGGFLSGALQTAAGVAGGILAAEAISSMLSDAPGSFAEAVGVHPDAAAHEAASDAGAQDYQQADYQPEEPMEDPGADLGTDFDGGDFGGGGDDSWI